MALSLRDTLLWYKRPEVRAAMIEGAIKKEIGVRFGDSFGKRPDALEYDQEILDAAQRGATSFHASEELWSNPRSIETGMNKQATNDIRIGWDLVLDVDFTNFEATKRITEAICQELEKNGISHFGVKFSGNKGFHIGVAWESFPSELHNQETRTLFPDLARQIADYLVWSLDNPDNKFKLSEQLKTHLSNAEITEHSITVCASCARPRTQIKRTQHFICRRCGHTETRPSDFTEQYISCPKCSSIIQALVHATERDDSCSCGATETREKIDLKIDTQLISSRHLYRLEYSLHEKSGFASLVIPRAHVLAMRREEAMPERIKTFLPFWHRQHNDEARALLVRASAFSRPDKEQPRVMSEIIWDADAAPEETFPPTMHKMLAGMADGKKRALFILTNFLRSVGWSADMMQARLIEWNKKNDPPLREAEIINHLNYHNKRSQTVLPPNFDNDIYRDLGVLVHDELSDNPRVKNPVQYVRLKLRQQGLEPKKQKKTSS